MAIRRGLSGEQPSEPSIFDAEKNRRKGDRFIHLGPIRMRENWYRDVWLFAISIVVVIAVAVAISAGNQANNAVKRIQQERIYNLTTTCNAQNTRHDATIAQLNVEIAFFQKHPNARGQHLSKAQLAQNIKQTVALIDALAPRQDCASLVRLATSSPRRKH